MPILSQEDAYRALDYSSVDELPEKVASIFLPAIDDCLKSATGKDWGTLTEIYTAIDPTAKMVASILLVRWFNDPGLIGQIVGDGIIGFIAQLEAKVLQEKQAAEG
jgi:hypothetical protein